jgi:MauM/NapG family ferredoxin protein
VACRTCEDVCPESAVTFGPARERAAVKGLTAGTGRREALGALALGLAAAFTAKSGISGVRGESGGKVMPDILVRPPGSRPEDDFLGLCTRCSLCIKACPTSMLQPGILEAGLAGLFAPLARPRAGPCEPSCNACGHACPTGAITALPPAEKTWAKMGTAVVYRRKCLAWEFDKACLVCDEACPYDAVRLIKVDGVSVGVPVVDEHKCSGCGYCENKCPVVGLAAIRVSPMAALRLPPDESYPERAKEAGLSIIRASEREAPETPEDFEGPPPGFEK